MTQAERLGSIVALCAGCGGFILVGGLLGWDWTFPVGVILLLVGATVFVLRVGEEKKGG